MRRLGVLIRWTGDDDAMCLRSLYHFSQLPVKRRTCGYVDTVGWCASLKLEANIAMPIFRTVG